MNEANFPLLLHQAEPLGESRQTTNSIIRNWMFRWCDWVQGFTNLPIPQGWEETIQTHKSFRVGLSGWNWGPEYLFGETVLSRAPCIKPSPFELAVSQQMDSDCKMKFPHGIECSPGVIEGQVPSDLAETLPPARQVSQRNLSIMHILSPPFLSVHSPKLPAWNYTNLAIWSDPQKKKRSQRKNFY